MCQRLNGFDDVLQLILLENFRLNKVSKTWNFMSQSPQTCSLSVALCRDWKQWRTWLKNQILLCSFKQVFLWFFLFACRWSETGSEPGRRSFSAVFLWPHPQQPIPDHRSHANTGNGGTFCLSHRHDVYVTIPLCIHARLSFKTYFKWGDMFTVGAGVFFTHFFLPYHFSAPHFRKLILPVAFYVSFSICPPCSHLLPHICLTSATFSSAASFLHCGWSPSVWQDRFCCCSSLVSWWAEVNRTAPGPGGLTSQAGL